MTRLMFCRGKFLLVHTELALLRVAGKLLRYVRYRGIGTLSKFLGRIFDSKNSAVVKIGNNSAVTVYLGDFYWSRLIFDDYEYEPDIGFVLSKIMTSDSCFIDCGANIGYWSIMASERVSDPRRVVAVEAANETFKRLTESCRMNGDRFTCIHAAVADRSGRTLEFVVPKSHADAHLSVDGEARTNDPVERVETVTIDDICSKYFEEHTGRIIVKLDVEGAEIPALSGATEALKRDDTAIIYEDHARDLHCLVTDYMINEIGYEIFFLEADRLTKISKKEDLADIKRVICKERKNNNIGFNLLAIRKRSLFWDLLGSYSHDYRKEVFIKTDRNLPLRFKPRVRSRVRLCVAARLPYWQG